jgi:hypothetical protein
MKKWKSEWKNGGMKESARVRSSATFHYYPETKNYFNIGEPIAPLLPPPIQRSPSPHHPIQTPLTPFNTHNASTPSSTTTNYVSTSRTRPPLIENFDNHLYESIRRNIIDQQNNNTTVSDNLTKHQLWTQGSHSSSNSPPNELNDDDECPCGEGPQGRRKRASTAFGHYKSDDDVSQNKYRTLSAHGDMK